MNEKINNPYKNIRLEEINRFRNGKNMHTLNSVDIVEVVICGGVVLEMYEGFFVITCNTIHL